MSFLLEFVGHLIKQSMEDPVARREARNAHLRDTSERAQALCVPTGSLPKHTQPPSALSAAAAAFVSYTASVWVASPWGNPMSLSTAAHLLPPALACTRKDKWAQTVKVPQFWQSEEGAATVRRRGMGSLRRAGDQLTRPDHVHAALYR
jgi:hypothetical protein